MWQTPRDYIYTVYATFLNSETSVPSAFLQCHNSILFEMLLVVHFSQEFLPEESTLLNKQPIFFFLFYQNFLSAYSSDCMMPANYLYVHFFPLCTSGERNAEMTVRRPWLQLL